MSSGFRRLRINTQERAMSPDINRLQSFLQQDVAELLRATYNSRTDAEDPGAVTEYTSLDAPMRAEIFSGLMVRPVAGNFSLTVDAGVMAAISPDAGPDESNYKFIRDDGLLAAAGLALSANPAGSARIDVIECRVNPTEALVTDSRDIFNASTGLFVASTVTKELKGKLEYRVRAGTAGSGFPGSAAGWLPLAVVRLPPGATSNDSCTFWDVRPLVTDRVKLANQNDMNQITQANGRVQRVNSTDVRASGRFRGVVGGRLAGGNLRPGAHGTDTNYVNLADSTLWEGSTNYAEGVARQLNLYLLFPAGLPRWARYTDGPSGRVPRAPYGIPVLSAVAPDPNGVPTTAITLPNALGLSLSTQQGIFLLRQFVETAGTKHSTANIAERRHSLLSGNVVGSTLSDLSIAVAGASTMSFNITKTLWPENAKAAYILLSGVANVLAAQQANSNFFVRLFAGATNASPLVHAEYLPQFSVANPTGGTIGLTYLSGSIRIPRPQLGPYDALPDPWLFEVQVSPVIGFTGNWSLTFLGYDF